MAIEVGLHCSHRNWQMPEADVDRRSRAFWTAYIIETTLAYNLGRPPSISADYITARLPDIMVDNPCAVLHIKHRRIQNKVISSVYCTNPPKIMSADAQSSTIFALQRELDEWRAELENSALRSEQTPYSKRYEPFLFSETLPNHREVTGRGYTMGPLSSSTVQVPCAQSPLLAPQRCVFALPEHTSIEC
jgi:hypothetical protein